ncbi:MAG: PP2C family protein-serine/threonine phosphatase, partial [Aquihabitans sp.]
VVIEVEPAEASFGVGFSEVLADCIDPILDMVRQELAGVPVRQRDVSVEEVQVADAPGGACEDFAELVGYAEDHAHARLQRHRSTAPPAAVAGVAVSGDVRSWGMFVECGGDWFDTMALEDGALGIVVGDVVGRGVEATAAMSDLRASVKAYAVIDGGSPARLVGHLDRLAETTGVGRDARLLYLAVQPATGEVRYANAGGCPPLVLDGTTADGQFAAGTDDRPLGAGRDRQEASVRLAPDTTILLFTRGLVESRSVPRPVGLDRLRQAAENGPAPLKGLCDHVLTTCTEGLRRDDDICLVGMRLTGARASALIPPRGVLRWDPR